MNLTVSLIEHLLHIQQHADPGAIHRFRRSHIDDELGAGVLVDKGLAEAGVTVESEVSTINPAT